MAKESRRLFLKRGWTSAWGRVMTSQGDAVTPAGRYLARPPCQMASTWRDLHWSWPGPGLRPPPGVDCGFGDSQTGLLSQLQAPQGLSDESQLRTWCDDRWVFLFNIFTRFSDGKSASNKLPWCNCDPLGGNRVGFWLLRMTLRSLGFRVTPHLLLIMRAWRTFSAVDPPPAARAVVDCWIIPAAAKPPEPPFLPPVFFSGLKYFLSVMTVLLLSLTVEKAD